jgi:D-galactarolactone cycloisomerase
LRFERLIVNLEASPYHDLFDVKGGRVAIPDGPGLGRDPDLDILRRYALSAPTVLHA